MTTDRVGIRILVIDGGGSIHGKRGGYPLENFWAPLEPQKLVFRRESGIFEKLSHKNAIKSDFWEKRPLKILLAHVWVEGVGFLGIQSWWATLVLWSDM